MNVRVEYFRMDLFEKLVKDKSAEIKSHGLQELVDNIKEDLLFFKRQENTEKLKYPTILAPCKMG